ncbi:MAG TPA: hypothetical protein VE955_09360 [Candidatus Dormibacteraeota bacterium]|jgi:hypothetical protein|nr:hypothetical protein [Candidatus Dormibacteraeota bacterium]
MPEPHPLPSGAIPSDTVRIPVLKVIENVGVLLPSRFTVKAGNWLVPETQFPTSVPDVGGIVDGQLIVEQFDFVAKTRGGTVIAGEV